LIADIQAKFENARYQHKPVEADRNHIDRSLPKTASRDILIIIEITAKQSFKLRLDNVLYAK
jgi:hypothetical protein